MERNRRAAAGVTAGPSRDHQIHAERLIERIAYVIPRVAARVPWRADCLVQALAGQEWLRALGIAAEVRIGVAKPATGAFAAHAWLVHEGRVLLGGNVSGYSQLVGGRD